MFETLLFETPARPSVTPRAATVRSGPLASKPAGKPSKYTAKYGALNAHLFAAPDRTRAPRKARLLAPHPLNEKDPFGEWQDAHAWQHHEVLHALERLPNDYDASCGYLRAHRPRTSGPALQFWNAPLSRAHAINALLNRGLKSVVQVHLDCDLGEDKLYTYADRWGMTFNRPDGARDALLIDRNGERYQVTVKTVNRLEGTAEVRFQGYLLSVIARFDPRSRVYNTDSAVHLDTSLLLSYDVAARLVNFTPALLLKVIEPDVRTERGAPLIYQNTLERLAPRNTWRSTLEDAMTAGNPCRCIFFDHHDRRCGAESRRHLPETGTAAYACEDHTP